MPAQLSYWDYVREAYHLRIPVPLLGGLPLNKLALLGFGILGVGNPGFWLLGLGFEAAYLLTIPGNSRFQNVIRGRRLEQQVQDWSLKKEHFLRQLKGDYLRRYDRLAAKIELMLRGSPAGQQTIDDLNSSSLEQLLWLFLKLLLSLQNLDGLLLQKDLRKELEEEIASTKQRIASEKQESPFTRSLKATLEINERRLSNLVRADESKRTVEAELDRIEKQITLLGEELLLSGSPESVSLRLDGIMQSLNDTTRWMSENSDLLESVKEGGAPPPGVLRQPGKGLVTE